MSDNERVTNWAGNIVFGARRLHRPETVEQVQELVAGGGPVKVLGSGHSFNRMADTTGDLVSLAALPRVFEVGPYHNSVRIDGGMRYGELAGRLDAEGLALHNMASLPHISVAGAIATATHGSGQHNGNLATAVSAIEFIGGDGKLVTLRRDGDGDNFCGAVVGLGALGVVTSLTLDVVPAFELRQYVYDDLPRASLDTDLDAILGAGYSVSLFTNWTSRDITMAWLKRRTELTSDDFHGAHRADGPRHPVPGMPAHNSTDQSGEPGAWHTRLPHFRMEFTPSSGQELQSEYHLPRERALEAIDAVAAIGGHISPVLQICELRTIAADDLWLSPNYQRDTFALHFTWVADADAVLPAVARLEEALAPFDPRPHWGKVFTTDPSTVRAQYEHFADFVALVRQHDPNGVFSNPYLQAILG
ncbi:D-arabinono-1,4-lactone oxidase [Actinoplanes sp. TFC3]|uniref:D-arabinono-1,4-lactone oxidase n=1 Tax=Actinoplanes sp. TFC3 TaxID=1710355 RepID=UPI00082C5B8C|nr:D-arabinono-1,4-lactone oxidase [Actinoplanes sp. TFC3]